MAKECGCENLHKIPPPPKKNLEISKCEDFRVDVCGDAVSAFRSLPTQKVPHTYTTKQRAVSELVTLLLLGGLTVCKEPVAFSRAH